MRHGTRYTYNREKCRCPLCTKANAEYAKAYARGKRILVEKGDQASEVLHRIYELDLTKAEVSRRTGINPRVLYDLERSRQRTVRPEVLDTLERVLGELAKSRDRE